MRYTDLASPDLTADHITSAVPRTLQGFPIMEVMEFCSQLVYHLACLTDQEAYNLGVFYRAYFELYNSWIASEAAFHAAWDDHLARQNYNSLPRLDYPGALHRWETV